MLCWYLYKNVGIYFDKLPFVAVRYFVPSMTKEEKKSIEKYPFISKRKLNVRLEDLNENKIYEFHIPKGYCYDGASIPRIFWRVTGSNTDNRFLVAALIHDVLCEHHEYVDNNKSFSTNVFDTLLKGSGVSAFQRFFMKNSVACYQTVFCKWKK